MSDLRLILLILGAAFLVGLYCWEAFFKGESKKKNNILDAIDEIPDLPSMGMKQQDETMDYSSSLLDLGNMIAQSRRQPSISEQDQTFFTNDSGPTIKTASPDSAQPESVATKNTAILSQSDDDEESDDITFSGVDFDLFTEQEQSTNNPVISDEAIDTLTADADPETVEVETDGSSYVEEGDEEGMEDKDANDVEEDRQLGHASDDLIVLYVTSPAQTLFNGLSISKAADEVGMVYGHMNVFHHFGPGKLHSGQPLFSMANMFEPGSFDLGRMADLKTKGVVLFMYSPASIEPKVVFELFLNTAQRLAKLLNGELRTQDNRILNSTGIQSLRTKAESLSELI